MCTSDWGVFIIFAPLRLHSYLPALTRSSSSRSSLLKLPEGCSPSTWEGTHGCCRLILCCRTFPSGCALPKPFPTFLCWGSFRNSQTPPPSSPSSCLSSPSHPSPISASCRGWEQHPWKWKVGRVLIDGLLQPLASCQKLIEGEAEKEPSRNFQRCCSLPKSISAQSKSGAINSHISPCLGRAAAGCSDTAQPRSSCPAHCKEEMEFSKFKAAAVWLLMDKLKLALIPCAQQWKGRSLPLEGKGKP